MGFMSIGSFLTTTLCLIASAISVLNIKDRGLACQENISPLISDRILLFRGKSSEQDGLVCQWKTGHKMWDAVPMNAERMYRSCPKYDHCALKSRIHERKPCLSTSGRSLESHI